MVLGLADETAVTGLHARDSKRVFSVIALERFFGDAEFIGVSVFALE